MATQTTVIVTDDLDGSANAKPVSFGVDGSSWTIDLSTKNRAAFDKALKPYIAKATKQGRTPRRTSTSRGSSRRNLAEIRAWAKNNGHAVSDRGRISAQVQQAYDAAH